MMSSETRRSRLLAVAFTIILLSKTASAHNFPYNPAQILMPPLCYDSACRESSIAYILSSTGSFLSFDFSEEVQPGQAFVKVDGDVPFSGESQAFSAVRTANDAIVVYAGDCGVSGKTWAWKDGHGWNESIVRNQDDEGRWGGPFFLGGSAGFSTTLAPAMDEPTIYNFGGMCGQPAAYSASWQSEANYSKTMMGMKWEDGAYSLQVPTRTGPRGPKYGMAGFSLTALAPSLTNISDSITQQTRLVVLGGHLENAFINMSTAAVWSLPAESWDYLDYIQPPGAGNPTGLKAVQERAESGRLDPRSGHTAVLSEDGDSVIVYGGWVGDVGNPALPQLAILELSQAYSGWKWTVPDEQPDAKGLYGHAAAILPGNVMMVYGGWEMDGRSTRVRKRAEGGTKFLNLTSMKWSSSYTNLRPSTNKNNSSGDGKGDASGQMKRISLGVGLGLGLAALLGIIATVFYCSKKRQRHPRDSAVAALAQDGRHFFPDGDNDIFDQDDLFSNWGRDGRSWYSGGGDTYSAGNHSLGYEGLRGAKDGGPSMSGINRKPVAARPYRGSYAPAQTHAVPVATSGQIHPIMEDAEEDCYDAPKHGEPLTPASDVPSDPFMTPTTIRGPASGAPASTSSTAGIEATARRYDPEVEEWNNGDVDVPDALYSGRLAGRSAGRVSPTRRNSHRSAASSGRHDDDSRTGSNLSESSQRQSWTVRRHTLTDPPPGSSSSNSFQTSKFSFHALQQEGPSLLLGGTYDHSHEEDQQEPGSPSKSKPPRRNWLGSLRRVFSQNGRDSPTSTTSGEMSSHSHSGGGVALAMTEDSDAKLVRLNGELLRRKKGRQDWEVTGAAAAAAEDENEWDVEKAVESRMVQVMFTVPRERLRVVNADEEQDQDATSMRRIRSRSAEILHADVAEASSASEVTEVQREPVVIIESLAKLDQQQRRREASLASLPPPPPPHRTEVEMLEEDILRALTPASISNKSLARSVSPLSLNSSTPASTTSKEQRGLLLHLPSYATLQRSNSHESEYSGRTSSPLHTAEAVRMARPKTRVLRMVDSIESAKSSGGSPQLSPERSPKR